MKPRIVVVGSVNMDLLIRVAHLPAPGETTAGSGFRTLPGGKGANQAVAAARMGAEVHFVGCIGSDDFGTRLATGMAAEGISLAHMCRLSDESTGVAMVILDAQGQNSIVLSPGANARLKPEQVDAARELIAGAQILVCQLETPLDAIACAIGIAHEHGARVILNPAPAVPLERRLLAQVDFLIPNETESAILSGLRVVDETSALIAARRLVDEGVEQVLVTLGARGVVCAHGDGSGASYPAMAVPVLDTTGAGDTFVGSFAAELAVGRPVAQAIHFAQGAAALKVTRLGAQTSIPRRDEVERFLQGHPT